MITRQELSVFFRKKFGDVEGVLLGIRRDARSVKTQISARQPNWIRRKAISAILIVLAFPALSVTALAQSKVVVAWNANPEPDVAGYKVLVGTSSQNYSTSQDVTKGTRASLTGLLPGVKYYCAVQAYNTAGLTSPLSREFTFTTQPRHASFDEWAEFGGLIGANAAAGAMPFHDGVVNLKKYAYNLNAGGPDARVLIKGAGAAGLPVFTLESNGGQSWFTVEFLRRDAKDLVYVPKVSTDLVTYQPMTGTTTTTLIDDQWERVIIRMAISGATPPRLFGKVDVSLITPPVPKLYSEWADAGGLTGANAGAGATPFLDGVSNLLKYAFNLNANGPDARVLVGGNGTAGLPVFALESSGSQKWFTVEFLRRKVTDLNYIPQISTDLVTYEPMTGTSSVTSIDAEWERVILRKEISTTSPPGLFARVAVMQP